MQIYCVYPIHLLHLHATGRGLSLPHKRKTKTIAYLDYGRVHFPWLHTQLDGFPSWSEGWQKKVAFTAASPRVQCMGVMRSTATQCFGDLELMPTIEVPQLAEVSTFNVKPFEDPCVFRKPHQPIGSGWKACPMYAQDELDATYNAFGKDLILTVMRDRKSTQERIEEASKVLDSVMALPIVPRVNQISNALDREGACVLRRHHRVW